MINKENQFIKSATFETGLSDQHKLTPTVLRKTVSNCNSRKNFYKDYKRFDQKKFETERKRKLDSQTKLNYPTFEQSSEKF